MRYAAAAVIVLGALVWVWAQFRTAESTANVPYDDIAMTAAYQKAIASLDSFNAARRDRPPGADKFTVKVGFVATPQAPGFRPVKPGAKSDGPTEYFWLGDLSDTPDGYEGSVFNEAKDVKALKPGQRVAVKKEEIADWMYMQNGKIVGNATACPALAHASAEDRRQMREKFGLACE